MLEKILEKKNVKKARKKGYKTSECLVLKTRIRNMFFLFDSLLANKGAWIWHKKHNQKIQKCNFSDFSTDFLISLRTDLGWKK